jgi:hypothetical protein
MTDRRIIERLREAREILLDINMVLEWHSLSREDERELARIANFARGILNRHGKEKAA